jgi:hypothetical protein
VIPDLDTAPTVLPFRFCFVELTQFQGVIFYLDRQTFEARFFRQPFWDSPTLEDAVFFQAKVEVMTCRLMFLHHEYRHIKLSSLLPSASGCYISP